MARKPPSRVALEQLAKEDYATHVFLLNAVHHFLPYAVMRGPEVFTTPLVDGHQFIEGGKKVRALLDEAFGQPAGGSGSSGLPVWPPPQLAE